MNPAPSASPLVWVWRHPQPQGVAGRCIGRTDVAVDPRRTKRLARRIQAVARRAGLARVVHTSPLQRCADVGRWLRRWGWTHVVDATLLELDFGTWDGQAWAHIGQTEVDAWCAAFATHAPGGGEPLVHLLQRAAAWQPGGRTLGQSAQPANHAAQPTVHPNSQPVSLPIAQPTALPTAQLTAQPTGAANGCAAVVVGHAGWMLARRWAQTHGAGVLPAAADWPRPPGYGCRWQV